MQVNSGQPRNFSGKDATPGDKTSNGSGQNVYQLCLPPQKAPGNYLTQITCSVQPSTSDQILNTSVQATKDAKLAQENQLNTKCILPTGKRDSQIIIWNMPSNCKIFIPVNNLNRQGAPTNNGPNGSHSAFNSKNILYMQQQTTSLAAVSNNSQMVPVSAMDAIRLNETRRNVNANNFNNRQQHANAPPYLSKESRTKETRTSLPSDLTYNPPTGKVPYSQSGLFGEYHNQVMVPERSTNGNVQAPFTCAQRAVAVVTPLTQIASPGNVSDLSANVKMNKKPVGTIHYLPNIPHPQEVSVNLKDRTAEPKDPASMNQPPKSAEPRRCHGLSNEVEDKSPIWTDESTSRSRCASSPKLKSVVAEQKSVPTPKKNECEMSEKNDETAEMETVPVIEWPLDRLQTLMTMIEQIEHERSKNVQKTDAGKEIIKLYWNGDSRKFYDAVQTGIYQNIMEEVYIYCPMKEPVILRQIKVDARNKVSKDFHFLKHNEEPPKTTYKSSWLNLNENVDDIDKECGYSWFYKSFQNTTEHQAQDKLQNTSEEPLLPRCQRSPTEWGNEVTAEEQTLDNKSLHENRQALFNGQSPTLTDANCSPKHSCVVAEESSSQPNDTNSLEAAITVGKDLDKQDVPTGMSDQYCNDVRIQSDVSLKSTSQSSFTSSTKLNHVVAEQPEVVSSQIQLGSSEKLPNSDFAVFDEKCRTMPKCSQAFPVYTNEEKTDKVDTSASEVNVLSHEMAKPCFAREIMEDKVNATSPDKHETSLNTIQNLDAVSTEEQIVRQRLEEKAKNAASTLQGTLLSTPYIPSLDQHDWGTADKTNKAPVEQQTLLEKLLIERDCEKSPPVTGNCPPKLNVVEEETGSQPNTTNPLKAMTNLMRMLKQQDFSIKCRNLLEGKSRLKRKHQHSSTTSRLNKNFRSDVGAIRPVLTDDTSSQSDNTRPSATNLLLLSKNGATEETGNKEEKQTTWQSNTEHPLKANKNLLRAVGEDQHQSGKGEVSESMHQQSTAISLLDHFCDGAKSPDVEMDDSASFRINVLPHEVAKQCFAGQLIDDIFAPPQIMHKLTDRSMSQTYSESPPKLYPVNTEPYQMHNEPIEEMPDTDYMLTDESVRCEPDPRPSQELSVNRNEEETDNMDALDSIKINVLSHEMAELWFSGVMEDKLSSHISNEDQVKVQDLKLKVEKDILLEDVKPKMNYQSSSNEKLESFCCLAKWFQTLECGNDSMCTCQEKGIETKVHNSSLQVQTEEGPNEGETVEIEDASSERTDDSESAEDENPLPDDLPAGKTEKDISRSEEVCKVETVRVSPSKCEKIVSLRHKEVEQNARAPDLKKTSTIRLSLYGSSSERSKLMPTKRYKGTENYEEPPETLQITIESHPKKCKKVNAENDTKGRNQRAPLKNLGKTLPSNTVSGLCKNALSSTSLRKPLSPSANEKSDVQLGKGKKRKKQIKCSTQQISMNNYIIKGKNLPSKLLHSSENLTKSKYELGNPALMPLEDGLSLEFKVLPESFNFEEGAKLNCIQGDTESQSTQNGMSVPEGDDAKRMKTSTTQGVWSFSPLKKKQTMDVSGPCSVFQEYKRKYIEKKEIASKQNFQ